MAVYGNRGGGKHSQNMQMYQQMRIEYVYYCIYLPYSFGVPIVPYSVTSLPIYRNAANDLRIYVKLSEGAGAIVNPEVQYLWNSRRVSMLRAGPCTLGREAFAPRTRWCERM